MTVPDPTRVAKAQRSPFLGPRILFFSGGTALRETSQTLINYTHNSIHMVTPFDSGGSSAVLRRYFKMPSVGDLRNRLMALADRSLYGFPEIFEIVAYRLPKTATPEELRCELIALACGSHPLMTRVPDSMARIIRHHLHIFDNAAGPDFDLRGASVGNLILTAGYLNSGRHLDPIVSIYSKLVQVRGEVRNLLNADLQLMAVLKDGTHLVGQHLMTGKEVPPITQPIEDLFLVDTTKKNCMVLPAIGDKVRTAILSADLICYPFGSFFSSVIANLLPAGVGQAVSETPCPKVFIPNTLPDPECAGLSLPGQVHTLLRHLRADAPERITPEDVLNLVLIDPAITYAGTKNPEHDLSALGLQVIKTPLTKPGTGIIDPHLLCQALVSLT